MDHSSHKVWHIFQFCSSWVIQINGALRNVNLEFSAFKKESVMLRFQSVTLFLLGATLGGENGGIPTMFLSLPWQQEHNSYFGQLCLRWSCPSLPSHVWEEYWASGAHFLFPLFLFILMLLACVDLLFADTGLALDVAAPPYLAVAGQCDETQRCVITTSTAKAAAARVLGARAASCSGRVPRRAAEARRVF